MIEWIIFLVLVGIGFFAGRRLERNHLLRLDAAEKELKAVVKGVLVDLKNR